MPGYGQSPWLDASEAIGGVGQNMNHVALAVAQMRYKQALMQQRQALALGQMAMRQQLNDSLIKMHGASADRSTAAGNLDTAKLQAADQLERAVRARFPADMSQGPTIAGAAQLSLADLAGAAERSRALFGRGLDPFAMHNVPPNNVVLNPMTQELAGEGATLVPAGGQVTMPGANPVYNPRVTGIAAGATPTFQTGPQAGVVAGPQTGFKPSEQHLGNLLPKLFDPMVMESLKMTYGGTNAPAPIDEMMYNIATNALANARQRLAPTNTSAPVASRPRVKVRAPDGRTGTIEQGDSLPNGWEVIQ